MFGLSLSHQTRVPKQTQLISINPWHQTSHKPRHKWVSTCVLITGRPPSDRLIHRSDSGEDVSLFACIRVWVRTCCSFTPDCHVTQILKMCTLMTCVTVKEGGKVSAVSALVIQFSRKQQRSWCVGDNDIRKVKLTGHVSYLSIPLLSDTGPTPSSPTVCTFFCFNEIITGEFCLDESGL